MFSGLQWEFLGPWCGISGTRSGGGWREEKWGEVKRCCQVRVAVVFHPGVEYIRETARIDHRDIDSKYRLQK